MSDTFSKMEVITGVARRRRFSTELKLAVVAETGGYGVKLLSLMRRRWTIKTHWSPLNNSKSAPPTAPADPQSPKAIPSVYRRQKIPAVPPFADPHSPSGTEISDQRQLPRFFEASERSLSRRRHSWFLHQH
jgi:hypothetical protein